MLGFVNLVGKVMTVGFQHLEEQRLRVQAGSRLSSRTVQTRDPYALLQPWLGLRVGLIGGRGGRLEQV